MPSIKSIGVVVNRKCERKYEQKKEEFKDSKQTVVEVFAYHATKPENVASIIKNNLDPCRTPVHGARYGQGSYFSEHPEFSFRYGKETMFIFKLLLVVDQYKWVEETKGFCRELVLNDASLFKPQYVLYF